MSHCSFHAGSRADGFLTCVCEKSLHFCHSPGFACSLPPVTAQGLSVPSLLSQLRVYVSPPSCRNPGSECLLPLKAKGSWGWHGVKPLGPNLLGLSTPHPNTEGRLALTSHPFPRQWKRAGEQRCVPECVPDCVPDTLRTSWFRSPLSTADPGSSPAPHPPSGPCTHSRASAPQLPQLREGQRPSGQC